MSRDSSYVSQLRGNLAIEYYKVLWERNREHSLHYRFNPLTGEIYRSDVENIKELCESTFYICWSEYPIYNLKGEYIGFYFNNRFLRPVSYRELYETYNLSKFIISVWDMR